MSVTLLQNSSPMYTVMTIKQTLASQFAGNRAVPLEANVMT
jgi:hypothetical protein